MMNTQSRTLSDETYLGRANDPYAAAASRTAIPLPNSPPLSHNSTDNSLSSRAQSNRSQSASNSHISSSSSVARSSDGAGFYSPANSEFRQSVKSTREQHQQEDALREHYRVLRTYLAPYLRDEAGNKRPTRARDKLLRLSPTQFNELSTDVFDELRRREDERRRPGGVVPPSLPPKTSFHPKRNQARQKLSTLPPERFRQLATDVFFELERRMPRITGNDGDRPASPTGSVASSARTSSRQGPPPGMRRPSGPPNGMRGPPPPGLRPNGPYQSYSPSEENAPPPRFDSRGGPGNTPSNFGRPLPQTFQSNTMVPNKSTMVEDDETDDEVDDAYGLGKATSPTGRDAETIKAFESQVADLQAEMSVLEERLRSKDTEIETHRQGHDQEKDEWTRTRGDLDLKIAESQQTLDTLQAELDQVHQDRTHSETSLRAHTEQTVLDLQNELDDVRKENDTLRARASSKQDLERDSDLQHRYEKLRGELLEQRKITDEVRHNAEQFLQEMRLLSEQSDLALEKEEQLRSQIASLEAECEEWKGRYSKARTQLRTLKASSIGLPPQHKSSGLSSTMQEHLKSTGLIHDVDVTNFQIAIDELLQAAREAPSAPGLALEKAKNVVQSVRNITADVEGSYSDHGSPQSSASHLPQNGAALTPSALKMRVSRDANNLVTMTRNHAAANGISPVSLVDAAASNLTTSVIEFAKVVGIKPTESEVEEDDYPLADDMEIQEIAPLSMTKSSTVIVKAPVPPQKQPTTTGGGWFSMLKGTKSDQSEDEDDEYDYS